MNKQILIVEDNRSIMEIYKRVLEDEGFSTTNAADGFTAREAIMSGKRDLLLLDVMLPNLDGLSLLKELKQNPAVAEKPVLIISNVTEPAFIKECEANGIKEYIVKAEVLPSDIVNKVKQYLA